MQYINNYPDDNFIPTKDYYHEPIVDYTINKSEIFINRETLLYTIQNCSYLQSNDKTTLSEAINHSISL